MDEKTTSLADRAMRCDADVRKWAFECGYGNLKARIESGAVLVSQAATTLTLLLAGVGGALAYAIRILEPGASPAAWGAAVVCAWLAILAAVLVARVINARNVPVLYNSPQNLLIPGAGIDQLQAGELQNLQARIDGQAAVNLLRADWLNRVRGGATLTPAVFAVAACVASWLLRR
jgi:hypothetical protein